MKEYVKLSLETHLFWGRIMKEFIQLLADYMLREANHYLRILKYAQKGRGSYGIMQIS